MLVIVELSLLVILSTVMYTILRCQEIESNQASFFIALNMILRSLINKSVEFKWKSWTCKIFLLNLMTLGFIILTYYKAQMNAALNSNVEEAPVNSWKDIHYSKYELLVSIGSSSEAKFKYAMNGSILKMIHESKILKVPVEKQLQNMNREETLQLLLNGEHLVFAAIEPYKRLQEYPCEIHDLKSTELRYSKMSTYFKDFNLKQSNCLNLILGILDSTHFHLLKKVLFWILSKELFLK